MASSGSLYESSSPSRQSKKSATGGLQERTALGKSEARQEQAVLCQVCVDCVSKAVHREVAVSKAAQAIQHLRRRWPVDEQEERKRVSLEFGAGGPPSSEEFVHCHRLTDAGNALTGYIVDWRQAKEVRLRHGWPPPRCEAGTLA